MFSSARWAYLFVMITAAFSFVGCSKQNETPEIIDGEVLEPSVAGKILHVYIWTNYHSPEAIKRFEQTHKVRVIIDTYDNNEVVEQKLQSGNTDYDVVVPTDYMVLSLAKQNLLLELDPTRLPGLANLDPMLDAFKNGQRFGVPYLWGTAGYAYIVDKVTEGADSWAPFFDPKNKGKIVVLDDMREAFAIAAKKLGVSINSTDAGHLSAMKKLLLEQRPYVLAYDSSDFAGKIQAGDAWLAHGYSGELATLARESHGKIKYVVPQEGATISVDNLAIVKASKNQDLAYLFIEFMLSSDVAAETTNVTGYATANLQARPKIKLEIANDPAVFPPEDVIARCEVIKDLGEATPKFDLAWTELKAQ